MIRTTCRASPADRSGREAHAYPYPGEQFMELTLQKGGNLSLSNADPKLTKPLVGLDL